MSSFCARSANVTARRALAHDIALPFIGGPLRGLLASAGGAQPRERRPKVTAGTAKYRGPIVALRLNVRM